MSDPFTRYVIHLTAKPGLVRDPDLVRRHVAFLRDLAAKGQFVMGGPFEDGAGGMIILEAESLGEAERIANSDPFVVEGSRTCTVREWLLSCEENNHMGMG